MQGPTTCTHSPAHVSTTKGWNMAWWQAPLCSNRLPSRKPTLKQGRGILHISVQKVSFKTGFETCMRRGSEFCCFVNWRRPAPREADTIAIECLARITLKAQVVTKPGVSKNVLRILAGWARKIFNSTPVHRAAMARERCITYPWSNWTLF